jgi:multidrug resistance efflux pump
VQTATLQPSPGAHAPGPPGPGPRRGLRRIPLAAWLGIALLIASVAGAAGLSFHSRTGSADARGPGTEGSGSSGRPLRGVAIGHVDVEGGVAPLYPLQPGQVVRVEDVENKEVEKGAPLLYLDDTVARAQAKEAEADLKAAEEQVAQAEALLRQQGERIAAQEAVIDAKKGNVAAARAKSKQARRFEKIGSASHEDVQVAEEVEQAAKAEVRAEEAKLRALKAADLSREVNRARQAVQARKAQLEKAQFALRECTLRAPGKGRVLRVLVSEGESLGTNPRQPAIQFCPAKRRIVRAEVEQEFAGRVRLGQRARIDDDATSNSVPWWGTVRAISDWYTHRRSILLDPLQYNDVRTLECIIHFDPDPDPEHRPRIGQRVRVTFDPDK